MLQLVLSAVAVGECGGYNCTYRCWEMWPPLLARPYAGGVVQWARSRQEFIQHMQSVQNRFGVRPELVVAPSIRDRWALGSRMIRRSRAKSVLDVGGIGAYVHTLERYRCINVRRGNMCVTYAGARLPYASGSFELVLAESVMHLALTSVATDFRSHHRTLQCFIPSRLHI